MKKKFLGLITTLLFFLASCASNDLPELSQEDKKADIFYTYGTQALVEKNYTDALDNLLKAYEINPKNSNLNNNLGMAYYFKGKPDRAIFYIKEAIVIDPKNSDAKNNLASIYYNNNNIQLAKKLYQEIIEDLVYPHQFRVNHGLALIAMKEKNYIEAENYLQKSIGDQIDYCPAHFTYGKLENERGRPNAAITHLKNAHKGPCVNEGAPLIALAQTYYQMGDYDRARIKFLDYVERFPEGEDVAHAQRIIQEISNKGEDSNNLFERNDSLKEKQSAPYREIQKNKGREDESIISNSDF